MGALRAPHSSYLCRDPDEFYELYDDVESTDGSSPQSRGWWGQTLPRPPARAPWDIHCKGIFCHGAGMRPGHSPSPWQQRGGALSERSHQLLAGRTHGKGRTAQRPRDPAEGGVTRAAEPGEKQQENIKQGAGQPMTQARPTLSLALGGRVEAPELGPGVGGGTRCQAPL